MPETTITQLPDPSGFGSDPFTDGWGQSGGPDESLNSDWQIDYFSIARYKQGGEFFRNCGNVVGLFDVYNEATATGLDWFPDDDRSHLDEVEIVPPSVTFGRHASLWLGDRQIDQVLGDLGDRRRRRDRSSQRGGARDHLLVGETDPVISRSEGGYPVAAVGRGHVAGVVMGTGVQLVVGNLDVVALPDQLQVVVVRVVQSSCSSRIP